jgi:hypothetical protein
VLEVRGVGVPVVNFGKTTDALWQLGRHASKKLWLRGPRSTEQRTPCRNPVLQVETAEAGTAARNDERPQLSDLSYGDHAVHGQLKFPICGQVKFPTWPG